MILDGMWSTQYCRDFESFHSALRDAVGSALDYFIFFVLDFFPRLSWLLIFFFHLLELELSSAPKENLSRIHFTLQKQKERKWHQSRMKNIRTTKGVCIVIMMKFLN